MKSQDENNMLPTEGERCNYMLNKSGKNNFQISSCNSQTFLHCNNRLLNIYISDTANKIIPLSTYNLKTTNYLENVFNIIEINHYLSIYVFFSQNKGKYMITHKHVLLMQLIWKFFKTIPYQCIYCM